MPRAIVRHLAFLGMKKGLCGPFSMPFLRAGRRLIWSAFLLILGAKPGA